MSVNPCGVNEYPCPYCNGTGVGDEDEGDDCLICGGSGCVDDDDYDEFDWPDDEDFDE